MNITQPIREALRRYLEEEGISASEMARSLGWAKTTTTRWVNGKATSISPSCWKVVRPLLEPYLPAELQRPATPSVEPEVTLHPPEPGAIRRVPVLGMAQAAGFEPALEAWDDYVAGFGDRDYGFVDAKDGWFALEVEGDSMSPAFPPGTLLLVAAGEFPQRGDLVVARLADTGEVVCKRYSRSNNTVTLAAINPEGRTITWQVKEQPGFVLWMWPVVRAEIDLRRRRWEEMNGHA